MWRSILGISIRANTQTDCGVIQLGRAKAAQLKRTTKEVSLNIPEWLQLKCHETPVFISQFGGLFNYTAVNKESACQRRT